MHIIHLLGYVAGVRTAVFLAVGTKIYFLGSFMFFFVVPRDVLKTASFDKKCKTSTFLRTWFDFQLLMRMIVSVTNRTCAFIIYKHVHCCDQCEKLDGVSFVSYVPVSVNTDTKKIGLVLLFMSKYWMRQENIKQSLYWINCGKQASSTGA